MTMPQKIYLTSDQKYYPSKILKKALLVCQAGVRSFNAWLGSRTLYQLIHWGLVVIRCKSMIYIVCYDACHVVTKFDEILNFTAS